MQPKRRRRRRSTKGAFPARARPTAQRATSSSPPNSRSAATSRKSPTARIRAHARDRGWRNLRLLSSANNTYNRDYHGEDERGSQLPALNVFTRSDGRIRHAYCTELLFAPSDPGQDARHVDMIWPLWNLFDFTREGRGTDWHPRLDYRS